MAAAVLDLAQEPSPNLLDRNAFSANPVQFLSTEDGAATRAALRRAQRCA